MKYKYLFIYVLILFILSINVVVASDVNLTDNSNDILESNEEIEGTLQDNLDYDEIELDNSQNSQFESASDDYFECYVGPNENGEGNGSSDNPFSTLMLARNKIAETNAKNAIINPI